MSNSKIRLTAIMIFSIVFFYTYQIESVSLFSNFSLVKTTSALAFFFLPIIICVYHIMKDQDELSSPLKYTGLFGVSLLTINELYSFFVRVAIALNAQSYLDNDFIKILPLIIFFSITMIISRVKVDLKYVFGYITFGTLLEILMLFYIVFRIFGTHVFDLPEVTYYTNTTIHIYDVLYLALPIGYLVFIKVDGERLKYPFIFAIITAYLFAFSIQFLQVSTLPPTNFLFGFGYVAQSLLDNYGITIAYIFGLGQSLIELSIAVVTLIIIIEQLKEKKLKYRLRTVIGYDIIFCTLLTMIVILLKSDSFSELLTSFHFISFAGQVIFVYILMFSGFFITLKKYKSTRKKILLSVVPSFTIVYIIYLLYERLERNYNELLLIFKSINTIFFYISLFVIVYYLFETVLLWYAHSKVQHLDNLSNLDGIATEDYHMFIMVPCMNEELVIGQTIESILKSEYKNLYVNIIDDASEDGTADVVKSHLSDSRLNLISRVKPDAQQGKGEALNYVYEILKVQAMELNLDFDKVLIAIIDADTILPENYFENINMVFCNRPEVTGLQSKVRVLSNNNDNAQDLEFAKIINSSQSLRSITNTVAFGGNGQFCKLSTLVDFGEIPWSKSLVEDFDLSTRLFLSEKVKAVHCQYDEIYIMQSGIENDPEALVKQRVRWAQGNVQSSKFILPIIKSKHLELKQKLELLMTLFKPWLMGIEYMIVIYTLVVIVDTFILEGLSDAIKRIVILFFIMVLVIIFINFVWAFMYNRKKETRFKITAVFVDTYYLTKFLLFLSQIYPQSIIRHFKAENGWDKTKRKLDSLKAKM